MEQQRLLSLLKKKKKKLKKEYCCQWSNANYDVENEVICNTEVLSSCLCGYIHFSKSWYGNYST